MGENNNICVFNGVCEYSSEECPCQYCTSRKDDRERFYRAVLEENRMVYDSVIIEMNE